MQQDADCEHFIYESFGIGEARTLSSRAFVKPVLRDVREFVVSFTSITSEAQNALLKLFEEPPVTSVFHVVLRNSDMLLPTLRSRLLLVDTQLESTNTDAIKAFLKQSYKERIEEIATRTKKKDVSWIEEIGAGAEAFVAARKQKSESGVLASVMYVRQYLGARGSSSKMLLEELALSLPVLK
ncbi:MAG: hypothetical protein ACI9VM_000984 [Candidatus Azotimanducaceae bacterium]|jgi:hypothetical protein